MSKWNRFRIWMVIGKRSRVAFWSTMTGLLAVWGTLCGFVASTPRIGGPNDWQLQPWCIAGIAYLVASGIGMFVSTMVLSVTPRIDPSYTLCLTNEDGDNGHWKYCIKTPSGRIMENGDYDHGDTLWRAVEMASRRTRDYRARTITTRRYVFGKEAERIKK